MSPNQQKLYMRCQDRNCNGRLVLDRKISEVNGNLELTLENPIKTKECTLLQEKHQWNYDLNISNKIKENKLTKEELERKSVQISYFKNKIKEEKFGENVDLIENFRKENPETKFILSSRDITLVKENLKRKNIEMKKAIDRIDDILSNEGKKFMVEKVLLKKSKNIKNIAI